MDTLIVLVIAAALLQVWSASRWSFSLASRPRAHERPPVAIKATTTTTTAMPIDGRVPLIVPMRRSCSAPLDCSPPRTRSPPVCWCDHRLYQCGHPRTHAHSLPPPASARNQPGYWALAVPVPVPPVRSVPPTLFSAPKSNPCRGGSRKWRAHSPTLRISLGPNPSPSSLPHPHRPWNEWHSLRAPNRVSSRRVRPCHHPLPPSRPPQPPRRNSLSVRRCLRAKDQSSETLSVASKSAARKGQGNVTDRRRVRGLNDKERSQVNSQNASL